jgi:hypothetical protein
MPTASFTRVNTFLLALGQKVHALGTDQLTVALCAAANAPVATNTVLANLTQISYTNLSARDVTTTSWTQTSGVAKLILADLTLTASGTVATFRYVVLYNNTATNDELIGWYDYGGDVTMTSGQTFLIDFDSGNGVFTIP